MRSSALGINSNQIIRAHHGSDIDDGLSHYKRVLWALLQPMQAPSLISVQGKIASQHTPSFGTSFLCSLVF